VAGGGIWYTRSQTSEASTINRPELKTSSVVTMDVELKDGGQAVINGKTYGGLIRFDREADRFDFQVYQPGDTASIGQMVVTVHFPRDVDTKLVTARHFASYGVQTPQPIINSSRAITFTAFNLTPSFRNSLGKLTGGSEYRIELLLPKGSVKPSIIKRITEGLRTLPAQSWLIIAVGLPLAATLILALMFQAALRTWRGPISTNERESLPDSKIPPAIAGVLVEGKVSPRSLAATLLHLAELGYLQVTHRAADFSFGKKRPVDLPGEDGTVSSITPFERVLLDKLLKADSIRTTTADIQLRIGGHVFSRKIAEVYLEMYQAAVDLKWFLRSPEASYRQFRIISFVVVGTALLGFLLGAFFGPDPKFYLLGWVGLFFVGIVMQRIVPFLPRRTAAGQKAYQEWLEFKNFLKRRQVIDPAALKDISAQGLYERYLPYAIVFGVEVEWTERFVDLPFKMPNWYTSTTEIYVIDQFANSLFPFIGTVAYDLAKAREPSAL
jgi:hypothetical protein